MPSYLYFLLAELEESKISISGNGLMLHSSTGLTSMIMCKTSTASVDNNFNPFPNHKFSDTSKLKQFANDNFKFDENGRKFSKLVENIVEKGEIARYEQFLLFPHCFPKTCTADA